MVEVKNFLYCLNINTADGRTDIVGILTAITPEYIPGLFSFSINFTLLNLTEGEHEVTIKFKNPENEIKRMRIATFRNNIWELTWRLVFRMLISKNPVYILHKLL